MIAHSMTGYVLVNEPIDNRAQGTGLETRMRRFCIK